MSRPGRKTKIFFVTDVHASDACFKAFLDAGEIYDVDVLIIGADLSGKEFVTILPCIWEAKGASWLLRWILGLRTKCTHKASFQGAKYFDGEREVTAFEQLRADSGVYSVRCDAERDLLWSTDRQAKNSEFERLTCERLARWVELADSGCYSRSRRIIVNLGNDDPSYLDEVLDQSRTIERPEGCVLDLGGGLEMISTGYANPTPWKCPRDVSEEKLRTRIDEMAVRVRDLSRCLFNLHCPPFGTLLDRANVRNAFGERFKSVGSTAVRDAIRHYQPAVGLHGHIHESPGTDLIGRTRCFNPGSKFREGKLLGVLLEFDDGQLRSARWTPGLEPAHVCPVS